MYNNYDLQSLVDNCTGTILQVPDGEYYMNDTVYINKKLKLIGDNVRIFTNEPISMIKKVGYGNLLEIYGITFSPNNVNSFAIHYENELVSDTQSYDLIVSDCKFENYGSAIKLVNTREILIDNCQFNVNEIGIYLRNAVNPTVINSQFQPYTYYNTGKAVFYDGLPTQGHSCGLIMTGNRILGFGVGIHVKGSDYVDISHNVVDYCDAPIILNDQDMAVIQSNFIGVRQSPIFPITAYGIQVGQVDSNVFSQHIKILSNTIVSYPSNIEHPEWDVRYGMKLSKINGLHVKDNTISFWNQHAIEYDNCYSTIINDNICMSAPDNLVAVVNLDEQE